jgi:hypothetical protein
MQAMPVAECRVQLLGQMTVPATGPCSTLCRLTRPVARCATSGLSKRVLVAGTL